MNTFKRYSGFLAWFLALLLSALAAGCGGGSGNDQGRDPILGSGAGIGGIGGGVCVPAAGIAKDITAYTFPTSTATVINQALKTIAVTVPNGTNVTALVAIFTTTGTGAAVGGVMQASGTTANNFTLPVVYTVAAADCSTVNYTVTVTVAPAAPVACFPPLTNTLANFAVLGGTALTCNASPPGTILITGDIGAPTQSCIPPQTAGFANYSNVGDPQLVTALADLQVSTAAASNLVNCPCATTLGATDLGGLSRTPGTYCFTGAITLTGTFTVDGPGVYIFRTASTLDTAANSIVQLANGATDANTSVYWIAVGATTLGADSVFKGTVMSSAAAITMSNNATLIRGRVLSGAAVTLANSVVTIP